MQTILTITDQNNSFCFYLFFVTFKMGSEAKPLMINMIKIPMIPSYEPVFYKSERLFSCTRLCHYIWQDQKRIVFQQVEPLG